MKKYILIMALMMVVGVIRGEGDIKVMFRDYNPLEFEKNPVAVGIGTWSDDDEDLAPAIYGQLAWLTWKERLRLNMGIAVAWKDSIEEVRVRPITSITTIVSIKDINFEVGGYYAPFWGLDDRSDDPYGILIGLAF